MGYENKEDLYEYQKKGWLDRKVKAILYKGCKCAVCGIRYDGDFHHLNPKEKEYGWGKLRAGSWDSIKKGLDKEICVCPNCHRLIHSQSL